MQSTTHGIGRGLVRACVLLALARPVAGLAGAPETAPPKPGDLVFQTDFDAPEEREAWSKARFARWETGYQGTTSLSVTVRFLTVRSKEIRPPAPQIATEVSKNDRDRVHAFGGTRR